MSRDRLLFICGHIVLDRRVVAALLCIFSVSAPPGLRLARGKMISDLRNLRRSAIAQMITIMHAACMCAFLLVSVCVYECVCVCASVPLIIHSFMECIRLCVDGHNGRPDHFWYFTCNRNRNRTEVIDYRWLDNCLRATSKQWSGQL